MTVKHYVSYAALFIASLGPIAAVFTPIFAGQQASAQIQIDAASSKNIIDAAKQKGLVGETAAGYLALTGEVAPDRVVDAMNEINSARKTAYTNLARDRGVNNIDAIAALRGEIQLAKAKPGEKVLTKQGRWVTVR